MDKFALVIYNMDGVYHYIPLLRENGTLEEAVKCALETINDGEVTQDDGDLEFEIVEIAKSHKYNTSDYQNFFEEKLQAWKKIQKEQQERNDKQEYERLKKRFDK